MKNKSAIRVLLLIFLFITMLPTPARSIETAKDIANGNAAGKQDAYRATEPRPLAKTQAVLKDKQLTLTWKEEKTLVKGVYHLVNPTNKKIRLTMGMPQVWPPAEKNADETVLPILQVNLGTTEVRIRYNERKRLYYWEIPLESGEELTLNVEYNVPNTGLKDGSITTGYLPAPGGLWSEEPATTPLTLILDEVYLGVVTGIEPKNYKFQGNSMIWELPLENSLLLTANPAQETSKWESLLDDQDCLHLRELEKEGYLASAANMMESMWQKAPKEHKDAFREGQAYYLERAGLPEQAQTIWEELLDHESVYPRVYWQLGLKYAQQPGRLFDLYQQVKEQQVHPLIQQWLATKLPPTKLKLNPPEFTATTASLENGKNGLFIRSKAIDRDGDISQLLLRYRWEDQPFEEKSLDNLPFTYEQELAHFIPAPLSLQRLYYEVIVVDSSHHRISTGQKETFYLNAEIPSETYLLRGANLVLGDFSPEEDDKVYKWFTSYLKMAREAKFVPIEAKSPYFIFLGNPHSIIEQYQGPLFIKHAPPPFSPEAVKSDVHGYFLSYWYGPGWRNLSPEQLSSLGDGLMLGRGPYVLSLKYLKHQNPERFAILLSSVGQGADWTHALLDVYGLSPVETRIRATWYAYGSQVLAVVIILIFAWLGKTGYLVRCIQYFKTGRQS